MPGSRVRASFVAVVTASSATLSVGSASANPPAPSHLPDPPSLGTLKEGEKAQRLRKHDGGCYLYGDDGPVAKAECAKGLEHPGEEIVREPSTGQCVLFEPWGDEPKQVTCPSSLVPAGWVLPTPKTQAPQPATLAGPVEAKTQSSCGRCSTPSRDTDSTPFAAFALAVGIAVVRRRR